MANKEVVVRLTAKDNFSQTLNKYEREMRDAGTATERLGTSSRQAQGGMNSFTSALKGAAVAMAGMVAMDTLVNLNQIGVAANAASVTFEQLTGGASNAATMLERLRATTNGAVSDFDLMAASNKLLLSGLAETDDEIAKITELSTKLGAAMGKDAASAMDEFNLMLLNQSIPRLDTFGISASSVRERINELTASMGVSREEAFKMAVFEEGAIAMDKLGDAANRLQGTALAQLEAGFANLTNEVGNFISRGVEAGAQLALIGSTIVTEGLGDVILATHGIDADSMREEGAKAAEAYNAGFAEAAAKYEPEVEDRIFERISAAAQQDPRVVRLAEVGLRAALTSQGARMAAQLSEQEIKEELIPQIFGSSNLGDVMLGDNPWAEADEMLTAFARQRTTENLPLRDPETWNAAEGTVAKHVQDFFNTFQGDVEQGLANLPDFTRKVQGRQIMQNITELFQPPKPSIARGVEGTVDFLMQNYVSQVERAVQIHRGKTALNELLNPKVDPNQRVYESMLERLQDDVGTLEHPSVSMLGSTPILDPESLKAFNRELGMIEAVFGVLQDKGMEFVDETEVENLGRMVDQSKEFRDYITEAADNFKSMSLSDLFGQGGGGRLGEFGDMVLSNIDDEATREAVARSFNLQSGRETDASIAFEEQISPTIAAIAEQQGSDAAVAIAERTLQAYEQALLQGMTTTDAVAVAQQAVGFQLIPGGAGGGFGGGGQFTVNPGDTAGGIAAQTGMSIDQVLAAAGVSDPRLLQPGSYGAGGGAMELVPLEERDLFTTWLTETEETFGGIKETAESTSLEGLKTGVMDAQTETESLKEQLDALSATEYKAKITVELAMANGLLPNLMGLISDVVVANGGKVPGTQ